MASRLSLDDKLAAIRAIRNRTAVCDRRRRAAAIRWRPVEPGRRGGGRACCGTIAAWSWPRTSKLRSIGF